MKKNLLFGFILSTFLLTGCTKEKKIECAFYEEIDDQKITYDYIVKYDETGNELQQLKFFTEFYSKDLASSASSYDLCENFINDETGKSVDAVKCKQKNEKNSISIEVTYNVSKMTKEEKNNLISEFDMTFEEFKDNYDEQNFEEDFCIFNSKQKMKPVKKEDGLLDILTNAKASATEDTAYGIIRSAETLATQYLLDNNGDSIGKVTFICDGSECSSNVNGKKYKLDFKGTVPTSGSIYLDEFATATIKENLVINGYICSMSDNYKVTCSK